MPKKSDTSITFLVTFQSRSLFNQLAKSLDATGENLTERREDFLRRDLKGLAAGKSITVRQVSLRCRPRRK